MEKKLSDFKYDDTDVDAKIKEFNDSCQPAEVDNEAIKFRVFSKIRKKEKQRYRLMTAMSIAASLVAVFVLTYYLTFSKNESGTSLYAKSQSADIEMCTVTVPVGETQTITLPDGTKMFANSRTTVVYPKEFGNGERSIVVKGEALIDVVHDAKHPFVVKSDGYEIRDVGTKFDINSYNSGKAHVVLLEGIVEVATQTNSRLRMKPGQMATILNSDIDEVNNVDVDKYTSWTKGYLSLDGETLSSLVSDLSQYYGYHISCKGNIGKSQLYGKLLLQHDVKAVISSLQALVPLKVSYEANGSVISSK
ncbi:MAG: FecR domain-containing protein [Prevotella sp.]|jgi:transmembrane sensor|nr:FecR domain-containing protein [Prevotella sp.]MCI1281935.1 FecR domain-containing protein [Prevotella sp.]